MVPASCAKAAMLIVGSGLIRVSQFVAFIPAECLGPIVLLTCCAGIYASNKRIVDVFTFLAFLLIGILLKYFKIPLLPLLIAYLLGSMMESNFRRSVLIGNAAEANVLATLFSSKISAFFLTISLLLLLWGMFGGLIRKMISKKHSAAEEK